MREGSWRWSTGTKLFFGIVSDLGVSQGISLRRFGILNDINFIVAC